MYNWILGLHSLLRWVLLIILLIVIARALLNKREPFTPIDKNWNLRLLIITHISLLVGLYQYFAGSKGFSLIKEYGISEVMKNKTMRFWAVEHITGMLIAIIIITISRGVAKSNSLSDASKHKKLSTFYIIALIIIIASIPWPFRIDGVPWFRTLN